MLQPRCECASTRRGSPCSRSASPHAAFSVPAGSTQSSDSTTSASLRIFLLASSGNVAGGAACSGWSVGNAAGVLMSVNTRACSFSASATRAFQPASLRPTRPARMTGFFAAESSWAACCTSFVGWDDRWRSAEARHVRQRRQRADLRFLQRGVEVDVGRAARRGVGDLRRAQQRFVGRRAPKPAGCPTWCSRAPARPGRRRCGSSRSTAGAWRRPRGRWRRGSASARGRTRR